MARIDLDPDWAICYGFFSHHHPEFNQPAHYQVVKKTPTNKIRCVYCGEYMPRHLAVLGYMLNGRAIESKFETCLRGK